MRTNKLKPVLALVMMLIAMFFGTGCDRLLDVELKSSLILFGAGYLLGASLNTTQTTIECFLNGDPIDCADMP